jgi:hypothetical protein
VLEALQRLVPALLRHLIAYGDLLCDEAGDALRQSRKRALGRAVSVGAGVMALSLACVWIIAANWDGPNRLAVVGSLCGAFAIVLAQRLQGHRPAGEATDARTHFPRSHIMRTLTGQPVKRMVGQAALALAISRPKDALAAGRSGTRAASAIDSLPRGAITASKR